MRTPDGIGCGAGTQGCLSGLRAHDARVATVEPVARSRPVSNGGEGTTRMKTRSLSDRGETTCTACGCGVPVRTQCVGNERLDGPTVVTRVSASSRTTCRRSLASRRLLATVGTERVMSSRQPADDPGGLISKTVLGRASTLMR